MDSSDSEDDVPLKNLKPKRKMVVDSDEDDFEPAAKAVAPRAKKPVKYEESSDEDSDDDFDEPDMKKVMPLLLFRN